MEYSNLEQAYCLDALLEQIVINFNDHYDYYQLNLNSWEIMIYNYFRRNKIFIPDYIQKNNIEKYNFNLVNDLLYYIEKRPKSELISIKKFVDYLNQKHSKNSNDNILIKYLNKVNRYKQKNILDNIVLAQYENDRNGDILNKLMEYINKGEVKQLYRYRLKKTKNYRKELIDNIYPEEVYGIVVSKLLDMGYLNALSLSTREDVIKFYVDKMIVNYQVNLLNTVVEQYYNNYGLVLATEALKGYVKSGNEDLFDKKYCSFIKYIPKRKIINIIDEILTNKNIDIHDMSQDEKFDTYLYDFECVKCKGN